MLGVDNYYTMTWREADYQTMFVKLLFFVGHQMMELVGFGMLDIHNVVHEYINQSLQMMSQVLYLVCFAFLPTVACYLVMMGNLFQYWFFLGRSIVQPSNGTSSNNGPQSHQIICCAYNANGTVFVTGSSDTFARVCLNLLLYFYFIYVWFVC